MVAWCAGEVYLSQAYGLMPGKFMDLSGLHSPFSQMFSHAKRANEFSGPWYQLQDCLIVKMIPMVMGDGHNVDFGKLRNIVNIGSREWSDCVWNR